VNTQLFEDFEPVSAKQWKQKIQMDLKGADYNDTLLWQSLEGIHVRPTYHSYDVEKTTSIPGHPENWEIAQHVFIDDETISNSLALNSIERGAEAIIFTVEDTFDVAKVFENFPYDKASIYFQFQFLDEAFLLKLIQFLTEKNATVHYNLDLLGNLARTGNWFHNLKKDHEILDTLQQKYSEKNIIAVDTSLYQNAGANSVQQLAYGLAHANEYLNHFSKDTVGKNQFQLTFTVATGSNYFFEIAKIRALRLLYASLASAYTISETCHVIATPSKRNKTIYDYNVNMLRTTTETMSAILGGADTVCNLPYDALYHKSNEFGERISRNQLLILKNESYFDTVSNPADGSYYIETLTQQLAEQALEVFKTIEKGGGLLAQLKDGTLQKKIKESASKEQEWFNSGKLVLVGTNKHPNEDDQMKNDLELYPFVKTNARKTEIEPIIPRRISEKVEQERLSHE
jgi:methylmalonyl-CoA mutase